MLLKIWILISYITLSCKVTTCVVSKKHKYHASSSVDVMTSSALLGSRTPTKATAAGHSLASLGFFWNKKETFFFAEH